MAASSVSLSIAFNHQRASHHRVTLLPMNTIFTTTLFSAALAIASISSNTAAQTAPTPAAEIAKVWVGQWLDQTKDASNALNIDSKGNFALDKKNYVWVGAKSNLPKTAGCFAYYEGLVSKATLTQRIAPDNASAAVLSRVGDDRFKQIELVCTDAKGDKIKTTDECQPIGFFFDQKVVYRTLSCKIGKDSVLMVYPFSKS
jgi:hypothetical protein